MSRAIEMSDFEHLCKIFFDRPKGILDFKACPGTSQNHSLEETSRELLMSLKRVGILRDESIVSPRGGEKERVE